MTWTIKLHDSVIDHLVTPPKGFSWQRKEKCQRFSILFLAPCDSQLRCKLPVSCPLSFSERVCMALSLQCRRILLRKPTSCFSFGNTRKQHHPALSCCVVKATPPQYGTETGVSWVCFVLGTCRILSGKMKFNVTFSLPLREVGSAPLFTCRHWD